MARHRNNGIVAPMPQQRLHLPSVTLCAVSSVNVAATIAALERSMQEIVFGRVQIFTDADLSKSHPSMNESIEVVQIAPLTTAAAYSAYLLEHLPDHVTTEHCLVVQWDGHVIDGALWRPEFLEYDYIGASWPQFGDGHDVGNGGFSLRSQRLLKACSAPEFLAHHPEDIALARTNRAFLESKGLQFAPRYLADLFAAERAGNPDATFGYHGVFLMPHVLGPDEFWQVYLGLDDRGTLRHDFWPMLREVARNHEGAKRAFRMLRDRLGDYKAFLKQNFRPKMAP